MNHQGEVASQCASCCSENHAQYYSRYNETCTSFRRELQSHREQLMKKLMEAELDSSAAAKQAASLKETLKKLEVLFSSHGHIISDSNTIFVSDAFIVFHVF